MPWKNEKDPYKIWISEIILQQTRVKQGLNYYTRFISEFSNVAALAKASEQKLYTYWQGLGYYNRCKNLHASAKQIMSNYKGKFPTTYNEIIKLKGIGNYTASAICSFAYKQPYAVVDGNVVRVLSRFFGINMAFDNAKNKSFFIQTATNLLADNDSPTYNQAIMDFGATVCTPKNPLCKECFFSPYCHAYKTKQIEKFPVVIVKPPLKERWFHFFYIRYKGKFAIVKRTEKGIWNNLYQLPLLEAEKILSEKEAFSAFKKNFQNLKPIEIKQTVPVVHQKLTHQHIHATFYLIALNKKATEKEWQWIKMAELEAFPFPKMITNFFNKNI